MAVLKPKLIFAVTNDLTYDQRMQKICRSLVAAGFEVELVGRCKKKSAPLSEECYKQTRLKLLFDKGKFFYIEYNLRLFFFLLFKKADAFCAIDLDTITAVFLAAKLKAAKVTYDAHEYFTEVPEVIRRAWIKRIWQLVEQIFVPRVHLAYTVSPAIAKLFSVQYKIPFHVIMNAPVLEQNNIQVAKPPTPVLLYQGALNEGRGLRSLMKAMQNIDATLLLAGEGDKSTKLREFSAEMGLQNKVKFLGFVKPADLKKLTASATIGINLLQPKGLSYYYSLSNKFFDYIHAGVPQVCIDFPEYNEINSMYEVAVLTKNCKTEKITEAIKRLIDDEELYSRLQQNCDVCRKELNWKKEEIKLTALYHELLR